MSFIVRNKERKGHAYVESIDLNDGDVEYTDAEGMARIFRGDSWAEIWGSDDVWELIEVP